MMVRSNQSRLFPSCRGRVVTLEAILVAHPHPWNQMVAMEVAGSFVLMLFVRILRRSMNKSMVASRTANVNAGNHRILPIVFSPTKKKGGGANCVLDSGPGGEEMCQQMNAGALISTYGPQGSARESPDPTYSFEAALCKPRTPWAWCWGAPCYKTPGTPTGITCDCPYMSTDSMVAQPLSLAGKGECAAHPPLYNPCDHIHNAQLPFADVQSEYCFVEAGVKPPCVESCSASDGPGPGPPPPSKSKSKKGRGRRSDSK